MEKIKLIVTRKPAMFVVIAAIYLALTSLFKWGLQFSPNFIWYLLGGFIGIYFLDIAEVFFNLIPSPFRSIIFVVLFAIVSFFIITSSGSFLAMGLVLSLSLTLLLWQLGEWQIHKNLNSWYSVISGTVSMQVQQIGMVAYFVTFVIETLLFLR